jgi:hypothetical protein
VQDALLAGTLATVAIALHGEGQPPHELLALHPRLLLDASHAAIATGAPGAGGADWEAVSGALRGFLLQLHHAHHALPPAAEGALSRGSWHFCACHQRNTQWPIVRCTRAFKLRMRRV